MALDDRVIILEAIDGVAKTTSGNIDPKIFTGENKLHAIKDEESCHWFLKYDNGGLPGPLKQRFTSYSMLIKFVENYYKSRNLKIKEIQA